MWPAEDLGGVAKPGRPVAGLRGGLRRAQRPGGGLRRTFGGFVEDLGGTLAARRFDEKLEEVALPIFEEKVKTPKESVVVRTAWMHDAARPEET